MKQRNMEWQCLLAQGQAQDNTLLRRIVLIFGMSMLGLILLIGLVYLPLSVTMAPIPVDPGSAMSLEQTVGPDYVLQTRFIEGRYLIPLVLGLLFVGAILAYVLRVRHEGA